MSANPAQVNELSKELLKEIAVRLQGALRPRAIYLFGSRAYGQPRADSDVDVLVVLPDENFSTWDVAKRGYGAVDGLGLLVELHFTWVERLNERGGVAGSFEQEILTKGRLLYAA